MGFRQLTLLLIKTVNKIIKYDVIIIIFDNSTTARWIVDRQSLTELAVITSYATNASGITDFIYSFDRERAVS